VFSPNVSAVVNLGGGEDCLQIGGFVRLDPASGSLLADVLPPLIHVRAASPHATPLRWLLDQLVQEQVGERPGASLASAQLAQLIFIQILRAHLEASGDLAAGWLRALGDKRIAPALRLVHSAGCPILATRRLIPGSALTEDQRHPQEKIARRFPRASVLVSSALLRCQGHAPTRNTGVQG
jgi:hypothetical protein